MLQTDVQEIWLEVDGVRIHCFVAGEGGSPVILKNSELYIVPETRHWSQGEKPEEFNRVVLNFLQK